jgi:hypothetical protein
MALFTGVAIRQELLLQYSTHPSADLLVCRLTIFFPTPKSICGSKSIWLFRI